jgi:hypothetical protein
VSRLFEVEVVAPLGHAPNLTVRGAFSMYVVMYLVRELFRDFRKV